MRRPLPTIRGRGVRTCPPDPWLDEDGKLHQIRVAGALAFNHSELVVSAAMKDRGVACVFADHAGPGLADHTLVDLLTRRCVVLPGYAFCHAAG